MTKKQNDFDVRELSFNLKGYDVANHYVVPVLNFGLLNIAIT